MHNNGDIDMSILRDLQTLLIEKNKSHKLEAETEALCLVVERRLKIIEDQLTALNTRTLGSLVIGSEPPTPYWTDAKLGELRSALVVVAETEKSLNSQ